MPFKLQSGRRTQQILPFLMESGFPSIYRILVTAAFIPDEVDIISGQSLLSPMMD
jgi:hypothetical protein